MGKKYASQTFKKVLPYLYVTEAGTYYGKVKRNGKIHKQRLETTDFHTAKNKPKDFLEEVESKIHANNSEIEMIVEGLFLGS